MEKLNLKLYAKYSVEIDISISLNKKKLILFIGEGVNNKNKSSFNKVNHYTQIHMRYY